MGKIFKVQLDSEYTQVPNATAKAVEREVSLQALGLLVNIMSYAETWDLHKTELYKRYVKNKRTSVKNAWDELVEAHYIMECRYRDGKKWDYNYYVRLLPFTELEQEAIKKQVEAQTPDNTPVFWDVDFEHPKMDSPKSTGNKKRTKEKLIKEIQTSKYVGSPSVKFVFDNYQPNKAEQRILIELIDEHGDELSLEAIQRAFNKGNKIDNVMQYIKGILENWAKSELKTVEEVLAYEKAYRGAMKPKKKKGSQQKGNNKPVVKPLPQSIKASEKQNQNKPPAEDNNNDDFFGTKDLIPADVLEASKTDPMAIYNWMKSTENQALAENQNKDAS